MSLLEKVEVLGKLDREVSIATFSCHSSVNKLMTYFIKKNKDMIT